MGTPEEKASTFKALDAAAGFLQRELKHRITIRRIPALTFLTDESIEHGARILDLIDQALEDSPPGP
jgi:ribosome-binding factor A